MTGRWERFAPLAGVAFVVLLVVSFIVGGDPPDTDEPAREVLAFYRDNEGEQLASALLGAYAVVFFLFFNGILRRTLRLAEGPGGGLSATAFSGGIFIAVGGAVFSAFQFTLADQADDIGPDAIQAILALNEDFFFPLAIGVATFLIATGLSVIRSAALPRWLGWVGLVIGVVAVTPVGFIAFLASLLWVLVVSVLLTLRAGAAATPADTSPG
jgi:hypothetical protein